MAYEKTVWESRQGSGLNRFAKYEETENSVILINTPDSLDAPGTQFSPANMNHIEQGIADAHALVAGESQAVIEEAQARAAGDASTLAAAKSYASEQVAAAVAATQAWLPAVDTLAHLPVVTDTSKSWLCRVRGEQAVYQCVAGQAGWVAYSDKSDLVSELELADGIGGHDTSGSAHADMRDALAAETQAREQADGDIMQAIAAMDPGMAGGCLPVARGGTGATTAADALQNLGAAGVASPTFTGVPKVPSKTSAATSDGTLIATEAQVALKANTASPVFTGTPKVPSKTGAATSDGTLIATEAQVALKANTASPVFTGTPKVPGKASAATSDGTLIATEAQVKAVADSNAQKACANELLSNPALLNAGDSSALPGGLYTISDGSSLGLGGGWHHVMHLRHTHGNGYNAQIAIPFSDPYGGLEVRAQNGASWSPWRKAAFIENDYSRIAVVAKTSDPYDTDLPIGSYIACCVNDNVQRALNSAVIQPRIQSQGQYIVYGNFPLLLSGTWRNSGTSGKASNEYILLRRVA